MPAQAQKTGDAGNVVFTALVQRLQTKSIGGFMTSTIVHPYFMGVADPSPCIYAPAYLEFHLHANRSAYTLSDAQSQVWMHFIRYVEKNP